MRVGRERCVLEERERVGVKEEREWGVGERSGMWGERGSGV